MSEITTFDGDMFWNESDAENYIDDPDEELDCCGPECIVEFQNAKRLPNFFGVMTIQNEESICRYFTTEEEAQSVIDKAKP